MPYVRPKPIGSCDQSSSSSSSSPQSISQMSTEKKESGLDHIQPGMEKAMAEQGKLVDDLPTPRPTCTRVTTSTGSDEDKIKDLEKALKSTSLYPTNPTSSQDQTIMPTSSSTSLASMRTEPNDETSASEADHSELGTPPTSVGDHTPDMGVGVLNEDGEDPLARYKEGLYAYTRTLYLEAKLSQSRKASTKNASHQFGLKQSGMEKLAAKKALAKRLNA